MQVYKAFFKIIQKNLSQIMIYFVVFISLTSILAGSSAKQVNTDFTEARVKMVFINEDKASGLAEGLRDFLSRRVELVSIPDDVQKLQDALFFRQIEYIVRVPAGFTERFLKGEEAQLQKTAVPDSASAIYLDQIINKYLNTAMTYKKNIANLSEEQLISYINHDLSQKTEVKLKGSMEELKNSEKMAYFFNYLAFSIFAILILGVSSVMLVFNHPDLKKRNLCAPIELRRMNLQMLLGNFSFAMITWLALILTSFFLYGSNMLTARGALLLLNSLLFTLVALSISFLIGSLIKSKGAMSAVTNVVSLGTSFISGVFVPQEIMGESVLKLAAFTPNYWYVKSNSLIVGLTRFGMEELTPIFLNMLIVVVYALAVLSVTLVIIKQKRVSA